MVARIGCKTRMTEGHQCQRGGQRERSGVEVGVLACGQNAGISGVMMPLGNAVMLVFVLCR